MRRLSFRGLLPRQRNHWVLLLAGALAGARACDKLNSPVGEFDFESPGPYHVARVPRGDTLILEGNIRLRLIGVHAAAAHQSLDDSAAEHLRRRVAGQTVTVGLDRERIDREGRILAYVYADGSLLNEELLRAGLSRTEKGDNFDPAMAKRFHRAEDEARKASRGIWGRLTAAAR